ncbi:MAG: hypothetical protein EKK53_21595 [Burkholderiales bacterium]|nr:MAG: hypothetical protein EKK53_21595 [Burkholderiales bacterium]
MKLLFCRQNSISSWLIRFFTWSPWSHVAIVENDEYVIDSTFLHGGVKRRPLLEAVQRYSRMELLEVDLANEEAAMEFVRSQIGKPYDWTAIFGFVFRRDWAEPDSWFCNELAEAAFVAGGRRRFREDIARITPRDSWAVV